MGSPLLGAPLAAVLGLSAGVAGTVAHAVLLRVVGLAVPVGLVLALALTAVVQAGLVAAWPARSVAVAGFLGWAVAVYAGLVGGPGGDFLISRPLDVLGAAWLVGGPLVMVLATLWVRRAVLGAARTRTA